MSKQVKCECADAMCPVHRGESCQWSGGKPSTTILYRVDMEDRTGTLFCEGCADDAMESGLFSTEAN